MLNRITLLAVSPLLLLGLRTGAVTAPVEAGFLCYGCCSNQALFYKCCGDPTFQLHALPRYNFGTGVVPPQHDDCSPGPCHAGCGFGANEQKDVTLVMSGDLEATARLIQAKPADFVLNHKRSALQIYSNCDGPRRLVGHIPLTGEQLALAE